MHLKVMPLSCCHGNQKLRSHFQFFAFRRFLEKCYWSYNCNQLTYFLFVVDFVNFDLNCTDEEIKI